MNHVEQIDDASALIGVLDKDVVDLLKPGSERCRTVFELVAQSAGKADCDAGREVRRRKLAAG